MKKQAELQQKREKKGIKADKSMSYNADEEMVSIFNQYAVADIIILFSMQAQESLLAG